MTVHDQTGSKSGPAKHPQQGSVRKNRGIRFSDPEWEEVKQAAQAHDRTPAEFVRERVLGVVRHASDPASATFPDHLTPLIERTFRDSCMLATRMRDETIKDGQKRHTGVPHRGGSQASGRSQAWRARMSTATQ